MNDDANRSADAPEEEPLVARPNAFALFGWWFIGLLLLTFCIGVGVGLAQSGHFLFFIPFFLPISLLMVGLLYRTTREYFRARKLSDQSRRAEGGNAG